MAGGGTELTASWSCAIKAEYFAEWNMYGKMDLDLEMEILVMVAFALEVVGGLEMVWIDYGDYEDSGKVFLHMTLMPCSFLQVQFRLVCRYAEYWILMLAVHHAETLWGTWNCSIKQCRYHRTARDAMPTVRNKH